MDKRATAKMKMTIELKIFLFYLFLIVVAETVTSFINASIGLLVHSMLLVSLLTLSALWYENKNISNLFLCLSIAPLIRIFSLALPLQFLPAYTWYLVAGIPMAIAAVTVIKIQGLSLSKVGITFKKPAVQLAVMLTGVPFGMIEYSILKPASIVVGLSAVSVFLVAIGLVVATGFVEELVFRGLFLTDAVKVFGDKIGLITITAVFAALHIGWLSILDVIFVFVIGLFFGFLTLKTGSIAGVSVSHGLNNVMLFIVMPSINLISLLTPR
jgi:membrane protease YdiL (CAAX protease family)